MKKEATNKTIAASDFVAKVAEYGEYFGEFARSLRAKPGIRSVNSMIDIHTYATHPGPVIEMYVDAEHANGNASSWGIELSNSGNAWTISGATRRNDRAGMDITFEQISGQ